MKAPSNILSFFLFLVFDSGWCRHSPYIFYNPPTLKYGCPEGWFTGRLNDKYLDIKNAPEEKFCIKSFEEHKTFQEAGEYCQSLKLNYNPEAKLLDVQTLAQIDSSDLSQIFQPDQIYRINARDTNSEKYPWLTYELEKIPYNYFTDQGFDVPRKNMFGVSLGFQLNKPKYSQFSFNNTNEPMPFACQLNIRTLNQICGWMNPPLEEEEADNEVQNKVHGGDVKTSYDYPWDLFLLSCGACTASIISEHWVVTATHCTCGYSSHGAYHAIMPGQASIKRYSKKLYSFPGSDFSLIEYDEPVIFSDLARPVCLPPYSYKTVDFKGLESIILGHGGASFLTVSNATMYYCKKNYICNIPKWGTGACVGDSGGPLIFESEPNRFTQLATHSFLYITSWETYCINSILVSASLIDALDWIHEITQLEIPLTVGSK